MRLQNDAEAGVMTGGELLKRYAPRPVEPAPVRSAFFPLPDPRAAALDRAVLALRRST